MEAVLGRLCSIWNDLLVANICQAGSCTSLRREASNQVPFRGIKELNSGLFALFLLNVHVYFMKLN